MGFQRQRACWCPRCVCIIQHTIRTADLHVYGRKHEIFFKVREYDECCEILAFRVYFHGSVFPGSPWLRVLELIGHLPLLALRSTSWAKLARHSSAVSSIRVTVFIHSHCFSVSMPYSSALRCCHHDPTELHTSSLYSLTTTLSSLLSCSSNISRHHSFHLYPFQCPLPNLRVNLHVLSLM